MTDSGKKRKPANKQQADRKKKGPKAADKAAKSAKGPRTGRRSQP